MRIHFIGELFCNASNFKARRLVKYSEKAFKEQCLMGFHICSDQMEFELLAISEAI